MGTLLRTLPTRLALACLVAYAGGSPATVPSSDARSAVGTGATLWSVGVVPVPALPRQDSAYSPSPARARSALSRYLPLSLDSRLAFAANNNPGQGSVDQGPLPRASTKSAPASTPRQRAAKAAVTRASVPVVITKTTAPGHSGYVHFFLLELPDGDTETMVGIELPDGRIAWSFPEIGVGVAPFMQSGHLEVNGRLYGIQHLYGVRPFPDDEAMAALNRDLWDRVIPWVEAETPYCNSALRSQQLCLSCLGFTLQVLFPGRTPAYPGLPPDFPRTASRLYYTTDDLLLYLSGLHAVPGRDARLARLNEWSLPENLRDELVELVHWIDGKDRADSAGAGTTKTLSEKIRSGVRSYSRTPPQRKRL